jgi:hypothetical protein
MQQVTGQRQSWQARNAAPAQGPAIPTTIEGLWVLLVPNEGELPMADADGRVPMMARAGDDQTYLLAFKNVAKARQFLAACEASADPRMVVRGNKQELLRIASSARVAGVLVDYDPSTQGYMAAIELG